MDRGESGTGIGAPRRMDPGSVPEVRGAPWLVERGPDLDAIAKLPRHPLGVLGEAVGGLAVRPTTGVLELLRKVPVVERRDRLDATLQEPVDQLRVERETGRIEGSGPSRLNPGPGDGEPVCPHAEIPEGVEIL